MTEMSIKWKKTDDVGMYDIFENNNPDYFNDVVLQVLLSRVN